ncbi:hypothetical protein U9R90_02545 [Streptomyces sp. E11-3]
MRTYLRDKVSRWRNQEIQLLGDDTVAARARRLMRAAIGERATLGG